MPNEEDGTSGSLNDDATPSPDEYLVELTDSGRASVEAFRSTHATQVLTILMTDLEGSTRQQDDLGNIRAFDLTREHRRLFRELLKDFDGQEVETAGDAFLVVFATPSEAIRFALHMQRVMREAHQREPDMARVRVGVHQGQIVVERHDPIRGTGSPGKAMDIYGIQVSTTARIMDLGGAGQVLCTRAVFDDARAILRGEALAGLSEVKWVNHGPFAFKGVSNPYDLCEVGEVGHAPLTKPEGSTKSHPVEGGDVIYGWRPGPEAVVPNSQWRLQSKLGEGGFGEVWLAQDKDQPLRKTVFKFCTKKSKVKSLRREKDVFDHLVHEKGDKKGQPLPGIVEVLGAHDDRDGGEPPYYIELAYCAGGDLRQWIDAHGAAAITRVKLDIALQMTRALARIHERGYIHRDVKPSNYLVAGGEDSDKAPQLKISDFGIGQEVLREAIAQGRATGEISGGGGRYSLHSETLSQAAGTFLFIAPELVVRRESTPGRLSHEADYKADMYSLGVSLYQLFAGSTEAVPGLGLKDVSDPILREDIAACLDPDPDKRPAAAELANRLENYDVRVAEREAAAERERLRQRNRRLAAVVGVASVIAVVSLVFGGIALWQRNAAIAAKEEERKQREIADTQHEKAVQQSVLAQQREAEANKQLYISTVLLARTYESNGNKEVIFRTLFQAPEANRNWEWGYLLAQADPSALTHTNRGALDISSDGTRVLSVNSLNAQVYDLASFRCGKIFVDKTINKWPTPCKQNVTLITTRSRP